MQQTGLDSYSAKLMFGDWLWWTDQVNRTDFGWFLRKGSLLVA